MNNLKHRYHKIIPIHLGWSFDEKFKAMSEEESIAHFIRICDDEHLMSQQYRFNVMTKLYEMGCLMQKPISFEHLEHKIIQTFEWLEGETLEKVLPYLEQNEQYEYGLQAGRLLKTIHSIPSKSKMDVLSYYQKRVKSKLASYDACEFKLDHEEEFRSMLEEGWETLGSITTTFQHGDYHIENMVLHQSKVHIIDFNRSDEGDPWQEFDRIAFSARVSPMFAKGQVHGYFDFEPSIEFYKRLRFYLAINSFSSIPWALVNYGESEVKHMKTIANEIIAWYQEDRLIPSWMK
jgi:aminoglycoside phosphotransferase (APT) family kinase protein